jgi:hypothetical protein
MGYPKKHKEVKETFLYKNYKPVAEVMAQIKPGETKEFRCKMERDAMRLRFHIYTFCHTFYGFLPVTLAIVSQEDDSHVVVARALGENNVEVT